MINQNRSGNPVTLSWPADHIAWRLQAQTNSIAVGLSSNWFNVANSIATNQITFALDSVATVFFCLVYP